MHPNATTPPATKRCSTCRTEQPIDRFYRRKNGQLQSQCASCKAITRKRWRISEAGRSYQANYCRQSSHFKEHSAAYRQEIYWDSKAMTDQYKRDHGCRLCGETDPACLDFHHRDPAAKAFPIANSHKRRDHTALLAEMEKCIILCANCHRKLHAGLVELH